MKHLFLSTVFIFLCFYGTSQTPVIAGVVPPGFHLDIPSVNTIQVNTCSSPSDSIYINFDQGDTVVDVVLKVEPLCSSFQRSRANFLILNYDYSIACEPCPYPPLPILSPVELGQSFSNLSYQPEYDYLAILNSSGTFLSGSCQNGFGLCGPMRFVILRKKVDNEYFYGWMDVTSCASGTAQLNFKVHSLTLFPKISVVYDTISCQNSYTFCDGFTLNNIVQDTAYDAVFSTANPNCDSVVRTRLHIQALVPGYTVTYDTICGNNSYVFPDGHSQYFTASNNYIYYDTSTVLSQAGCDSLNVVTHLYVRKVGYGGYHGFNVCPNSSFTFPDGMVITNITQSTQHTSHFIGVNGCDSTTFTVLNIANTYTLNQAISICAGSTLVVGNHIYTTSGNYIDTLQTIYGCDSVIITQLTVLPNGSSYNQDHVCLFDSFIFPDGSVLNSIAQDTLQMSYLLGPNGCHSMVQTQLYVVTIDTSLALNGNVLISSNNSLQANYQWIDCSSNTLIPGATGQNFSIPAPGHYAVVVNLYGCIDTSVCFFATGIHDVGTSGEIYFTNPVTDRIQFSGSNDKEKFLMNSVGQILIKTTDNIMPLGDLPLGIYFLRVGEKVWKLLKN